MKFKKGDLVEVMKEDDYLGYIFPKGSRWIVYEDQYDDNIINVHDDRHELGYSILWTDYVIIVDHPYKKSNLKEGLERKKCLRNFLTRKKG